MSLGYLSEVNKYRSETRPNRVSDAKFHSLTFRPIRHDPNGVPLEPAMIAKEHGNVTPLLRLGRGEIEPFGFHTAGFAQGHNELPVLVNNGILNLFIVIATVC